MAPAGAPLIVSVCSVLLSPVWLGMVAASVPSAIAVPSTPGVAAPHVTVGAVGPTVTASVAVAGVLMSPFKSFLVAVAVSVKLTSLVGVIVSDDRVQPTTLIGVEPSLVMLWP